MPSIPKVVRALIKPLCLLALVVTMSLGGWIGWGSWPETVVKKVPWVPDMILVLGGGNEDRPDEALRLAAEFPDVPVLVTGDGGTIRTALLEGGLRPDRLLHEPAATSTVENALLTAPILDEQGSKKILLVTNWFHVPRATAIFKKYQPEREFAAAFTPRPARLDNWHREVSRRERLAALHHLVRYGIWSFR